MYDRMVMGKKNMEEGMLSPGAQSEGFSCYIPGSQ